MPFFKKSKLNIEVSEKDIQNTILEYLSLKKHFFWRNNSVGVYDTKSKGFRKLPKYCMAGTPDIILIKDGFFIGLEVKKKNTKQSDNQKKFEKGCKGAGGEYYVVRSIENLKEIGL